MNPLKCAFTVSAGKFLGFIVHEKGVEIDPKKIESIKKVQAPTCKKELQRILGKVNYLRRFICKLFGKVDAFTPLLRLKSGAEFTWGQHNKKLLMKLRAISLHRLFFKHPRMVFHSDFMLRRSQV
jgi:hypothetical protein